MIKFKLIILIDWHIVCKSRSESVTLNLIGGSHDVSLRCRGKKHGKCFSDIGQILSRWMAQQGARHLTYLSRSGAAQESAQRLLTELHRLGVTTEVVIGDVGSMEDVTKAIARCNRPIRGVVQGALVLKVINFSILRLSSC